MLLPSAHHIVYDINYLNTINKDKALHYVNEFGICTIDTPINSINAVNTEYDYIKTSFPIAENIY
ncbi:Mannose-1-phosphate guanylyltransferase [Rickettsia canadensis str. McKiel]|uniref:Mannose-1-phosphate guanylyltransferase n=1 Tax=Rickettsia canadensis (strain McKiel) TaxID=293613 RepID=A8EZP6_RICCK|nr:mannose-1-phosphate guanylyltransferase [Rickettsia canadensis]ABV73829.1 Mannose-1-phosphate guanylyltransferase [Rickettsia canadensis str. McKiel]